MVYDKHFTHKGSIVSAIDSSGSVFNTCFARSPPFSQAVLFASLYVHIESFSIANHHKFCSSHPPHQRFSISLCYSFWRTQNRSGYFEAVKLQTTTTTMNRRKHNGFRCIERKDQKPHARTHTHAFALVLYLPFFSFFLFCISFLYFSAIFFMCLNTTCEQSHCCRCINTYILFIVMYFYVLNMRVSCRYNNKKQETAERTKRKREMGKSKIQAGNYVRNKCV